MILKLDLLIPFTRLGGIEIFPVVIYDNTKTFSVQNYLWDIGWWEINVCYKEKGTFPDLYQWGKTKEKTIRKMFN